ncbi:AAA family ATPase [Priestia aryabhattai]|uniref:AAA family ATPase n=1 Tax=Priestia aryabhattai TaxID=412384 RepID=UPI003D277D6B
MFIKQIKVDKFKKLENFKLTFPESKIIDLEKDKEMKLSVIIGENGTAKTTIFELIINSFASIQKNIELDNCEITYLLEGVNYTKTENSDVCIRRPANIVVSSYTPIDKLDISKELVYSNDDFFKKTNIAQSIKESATRILKKYASNRFAEVYSILEYIGYEKREICFELLDYQIRRSYALDKIIRKIGLMDEEISFNNINLDLMVDDKIHTYANELEEFSSSRNGRSRANMFKKKIDRALTYVLRDGIATKIPNVSLKKKHYVIEGIFILEKFLILLRTTASTKSKYKNGNIKLLSTLDIDSYPGGKGQLLRDLEFLDLFSVNLLSDVWFQNKYDAEQFPLSMLSSGELSMFMRFFDLDEYVKDNSIVLIDEPETHLHPKWIRGYIKTLIKLLGDRKCHVLIATHSPLIVSDVTKSCIIGLKKDSYNIRQVKIDDKTLGLNYEEVLSEVFCLEDYKGKMIEEYVDMIDKLLKYEDFDKALSIYSQIGNSEIKYNLFLKLKAFKDSKGDKNV